VDAEVSIIMLCGMLDRKRRKDCQHGAPFNSAPPSLSPGLESPSKSASMRFYQEAI
jgi:hypothetical protein